MLPMIEYVLLLLAGLRATVRGHGDLVAENLLLRHQLAVLTRPTRKRPRLRRRDKALWLLAHRTAPLGAGTSSSSSPRRLSAGTGRACACSCGGGPPPRSGTR